MSYRGPPTLGEEIGAWRAGYRHVAGVDEVGRGPMAGPVVAAAVVLDPQFAQPWWSELRDSKLLSGQQRALLAERLRESAGFGVGQAGHDEIDALGLVPATRQAMSRALNALPFRPDFLLIDAVSLPPEVGPDGYATAWAQHALIHGDRLSLSIAAASIIAKVARDALMDEYDETYPGYGFTHNRGYCTRDHLRALAEQGPCLIHRRSFAPVRAYLEHRQP